MITTRQAQNKEPAKIAEEKAKAQLAVQAQLQAITQEMRQKADELMAREEMAVWGRQGEAEAKALRFAAERIDTLMGANPHNA